MTRDEAHQRIDSGTLTWGELKTLLRGEIGAPARTSTVNPGMTHEQAVTILAAGIENRDDGDIVAGPKSHTPNRDRLAATNILRECGSVSRSRSRKRYCGMCDVWMKATPGKECPFCGADTELEPGEAR